MKTTISKRVLSGAVVLFLFGGPLMLAAQTVTYTFDGPGYTEGEYTPINNAAPDLDPANTGYTADFGDSAPAETFEVISVPVGTGNSLFEPTATAALSVSGSFPVTELSLDWSVNAPPDGGTLVFISNLGSVDVSDPNGSGQFATGHLDFVSTTPFTSFSLQGYDGADVTQLDVDNISLTVVPEPDGRIIILLVAGALLGARVGFRRWMVARGNVRLSF